MLFGFRFPRLAARVAADASQELVLRRGRLMLALEHWHYDTWIAREDDQFSIHVPHAFDRTSHLVFETSADGDITGISIRFEPAVGPIRLQKR